MRDGHEACIFPPPSRHLCLIPHAILPYPPRRFTLSPKPPFHLFTFSPLNALSPFHLFTLPPFPLFPISPFHPFTLKCPFTLSPFHPFTFKCPFTLSPFKGRSHLFTLSPFHPFTFKCLFIFSPFHPPLTTANTLVLRTLAPRKPIFMQQMR